MNSKSSSEPRTKLSDKEYLSCMDEALAFLKAHASIRNRELRGVTGINYDQAIAFFNRAISEGRLLRMGHSSGTHYVLPHGV